MCWFLSRLELISLESWDSSKTFRIEFSTSNDSLFLISNILFSKFESSYWFNSDLELIEKISKNYNLPKFWIYLDSTISWDSSSKKSWIFLEICFDCFL